MRSSKPFFSLAAIFLQLCLFIPFQALADTYKVFTLDTDQARFAYGIDPSGDVVLSVNTSPGSKCDPGKDCYETFIGGVLALVLTSQTLTAMSADELSGAL